MKSRLQTMADETVEAKGREPCPFCGSKDTQRRALQSMNGAGKLVFHKVIRCNVCRAQGPKALDNESARQLWNGRTNTSNK